MLHGNVGRRRVAFSAASERTRAEWKMKNHKAIHYKSLSKDFLIEAFLCILARGSKDGGSWLQFLGSDFTVNFQMATKKKHQTYVACLRPQIRIIKVAFFPTQQRNRDNFKCPSKAYKSSLLGLFISKASVAFFPSVGTRRSPANICWVNVGRKLIKGFCNFFRLQQTESHSIDARRTRRTWT